MKHAANRLENVFERVPVVNSQQLDCEHASMPDLRFATVSILFSIAVANSAVAGQTIPSPYKFIENSQELAFFTGKSDVNPGQLGLGPRDATTFGGRWAPSFGSLSLDLSGTWFDSKREVRDVLRPVDDRVIGESNIDILLFDARLRLNLTGGRTWHRLQPFVTFGGGLAFSSGVDRIVETVAAMPATQWYSFGTRITGTVTGGTNFHISNKISLRLEGVWNLWKIVTPVGWLTLSVDPLGENTEGEWVSTKSIMLGASWRY